MESLDSEKLLELSRAARGNPPTFEETRKNLQDGARVRMATRDMYEDCHRLKNYNIILD